MAKQREHTNVCVVESRWWRAKNTSVRNVFELLSDLHTGSSNGYEYEMANSRVGFKEVVERQLANPNVNYMTLATHGSGQGLTLFNDDGISRSVLRNILKRTDDHRNLVGLHLGSCSFFNKNIAEFLYDEDISPWWVAGYEESVSWVESTSLDFLFFNKILEHDDELDDPVKTIRTVTSELAADCGGLVERLSFQVFICLPHKSTERIL